MQNDKNRLDHDLGFLDEVKPRDADTKAVSKYKFNWRNIIVIVGIVGCLYIWGSMSNNTPTGSSPSSSINIRPASNKGDTVSNGQFRCSSYDSRQADALSPPNELAIQKETDDLTQRSQELDEMSAKIKASTTNQSSPQYLIDSYNRMIDSYNKKLAAFKSNRVAHQRRVDTFNAQVEVHNNYLIAHCTRAY